MTRNKVKLAYITKDSARKATFKKRKKGLMKKVSELSILCGVDVCAIVYGPYDANPEVWPSPTGVQRVVAQFKRMPEMEQSKKMVNQDSFFRQRIIKASEQLNKQRKDNRENEMTHIMFQCLIGRMNFSNLSMMDLKDIGWLIDQYVKEINKRADILRNEPSPSSSSQKAETLPPSDRNNGAVISQQQIEMPSAPLENIHMDFMQRKQCLMDHMNLQENHMGFNGDDMVLPFGDPSHSALWNNGFFP